MPACSNRAAPRWIRTFLAIAAAALLQAATARAADGPLVGRWRQSAWKLCKPVAQLGPSDIDPPIDELVFNADGTFSVTWRGGGAATGDVAHVVVPDYQGRYTVDASAGGVRMQIANGLFVPQDFAGNGAYTISGNDVTFTGVWFGTRQAKRKPDICELTFTKQ